MWMYGCFQYITHFLKWRNFEPGIDSLDQRNVICNICYASGLYLNKWKEFSLVKERQAGLWPNVIRICIPISQSNSMKRDQCWGKARRKNPLLPLLLDAPLHFHNCITLCYRDPIIKWYSSCNGLKFFSLNHESQWNPNLENIKYPWGILWFDTVMYKLIFRATHFLVPLKYSGN